MTRDSYLGLAAYLAGSQLSIKEYCNRRGIRPGSLCAKATRAGVHLGLEIRRRRVAIVERILKAHPDWSVERAALEGGFPFASGFHRAKRSLEVKQSEADCPVIGLDGRWLEAWEIQERLNARVPARP